MTNNLNKAHHIGIVVQDIQASEAWYVEHLGFEPLYTYGWPGVKVAFIKRGDLKSELFQNEQAAPMDGERQAAQTNLRIGGINHFAIEVEDLDEAVSILHAKGVEIVSPPKDVPNGGGDRFAFIHDNEHMLVELFQPA
jgi:catechol 2,3-dioxygenase-like lactoylglutathione lyase family enzyme